MKAEQLTVWKKPTERMDSEYGVLTYENWIEEEIDRLSRTGKFTYFKKENKCGKGVQIAIFKRKKSLHDVRKERKK